MFLPFPAVIFASLLLLHTSNAEDITISTQLGSVTGLLQNNYFEFRGIPYTELPPTGSNRFLQSTLRNRPYTDDDSPYNATYFRPACIQSSDELEPIIDEDCLYLNVFTPNINTTTQSPLPVMFWIHGGGWQTGSGYSIYDGKGFMNQEEGKDIVYVSINYRLGALGYLSLQSILEETNGLYTGGLNGIIDQIVALQWVKNYISEFGGDPNRVTVFGESAGAISICMLISTQSQLIQSQNLFNQSIIQSGPCLGFPTEYQYGLQQGIDLLADNDWEHDLDALRALDATDFIGIYAGPAADGYLMEYSINETTAIDMILNTDKLMIGFTSLDSLYAFPWYAVSVLEEPPKDIGDLDRYLDVYMDNNDTLIDMIKERYYPIEDFKENMYIDELFTNYSMLWYTMNADVCFICPSIHYADILQQGVNNAVTNNDMYLYYFMGVDPYYIPHAGELMFLFNNSDVALNTFGMEWSDSLASFMIETWVNFGVYGTPNSTLFPQNWTAFSMDETVMMFKDENGMIETGFLSANYRNGVCDFWINDVDQNIVSNLCGQSLSVSQLDESEDDGLPTWAIVIISIGGVIVFLIVCGVMIKYKCCYYVVLMILMIKYHCCSCCNKDKSGYSKMESGQDDEQLVNNQEYGAVAN